MGGAQPRVSVTIKRHKRDNVSPLVAYRCDETISWVYIEMIYDMIYCSYTIRKQIDLL